MPYDRVQGPECHSRGGAAGMNMALPLLRRAAVAGSWYPANPEALAREVDRYLAAVDQSPSGDPLAVIAPHAGLRYSGPVAAYSYQLLRGRQVDVAVLVGPSHYVGFDGVAIYEHGAFETPLGPATIAEHCAAAIALASRRVREHPAAHAREHSLEMQLPFLKRVLPNTPIVPLVMGYQHRDMAYELGEAIAASVKGARVVLIASTDLSHYQNAETAAKLDNTVIQHVLRFDPDGLMSALEAYPHHACGGGPTVSVMLAAKALGATDSRVLKYGDSGDVSGDKDAVVGYLSAAFGSFQ
jgi:AmmeMemoRadiSam system protein B